MTVYSSVGSRLDGEEASPHRRRHAGPRIDGGKALRSGCLSSRRLELLRTHHLNGLISHIVFLDTPFATKNCDASS
jgi:hypothetical protein